jgi:hypothetical protein
VQAGHVSRLHFFYLECQQPAFMRHLKIYFTVLSVLIISLTLDAQIQLTAGQLRLGIDNKGQLTSLVNASTKKNYLYADTTAPLLTLVHHHSRILPSTAVFNKARNIISLQYPDAVSVDIRITAKKQWLVMEIIKAVPDTAIEAVVWGPFPTTIQQTVGEVIGVVRDDAVSIGIQLLNTATLGGDYPNNEGSTWSRGITALPASWGSRLQAYTINRSIARTVDAWGGEFKNMPVPIIKDATVTGSKIALFSCTAAATLEQLEAIALAEKLPYPTINKTWLKKSPLFGKSYLISSFGENEVDEMIAYTKIAGLISLYHEGPFKSWGHYIPDPEAFPNGRAGLKTCADKAHAAGLLFGVHTLTNFINTNDPYITPVPDDRLSVTGSSTLVKEIDARQKEIELVSPEYFNQEKNNNLHTIKIGKELVRYKSISNQPPYTLQDCQRGAFGTIAAAHAAGTVAGKLFDHAYQVFFPNLDLQREIARNMARLFNETGIDHFDLDGHEGCLASGQGDYALELFAKDVYDNMKHEFICGTSNSKPFFWNIGAYYNWGEPWYGGFKESMQQYRIDNQGLFSRNYMPHMLGWYLLGETTTLAEMEWMLARAAGYDAGFALVARPKALRTNPLTPLLLAAIREWEAARTTHAFTLAQQEQLKQPGDEFHLEKLGEGKWKLYQYSVSATYTREYFERQPGEPTFSTWNYQQEYSAQPLQFRLNITGTTGSIKNIKMQVDNYTELLLPVELKAGESLVCDGSTNLRIYNETGKPRGSFTLPDAPPLTAPGTHTIIFDCSFSGGDAKATVQFRGLGKMETVQASSHQNKP